MKTLAPKITVMNTSVGGTPSCTGGCPHCQGVGHGRRWVWGRVPLSITCPELSFLPQGSGVMTHRTPNAVSGAKCGCVGAVQGSDPRVSPQCPAESTLGSISKAQWGVEKGKAPCVTQTWEWLEELHFQGYCCRDLTNT